MAIKRKIRLNLRDYGELPALRLSQYDEGYTVEFELRDGASAATGISAYSFTLHGTRSDGLAYSFDGTLTDNVASFEIDTTMTGRAGLGRAELQITDSSDLLYGTYNVPVFVEPSPVPDGAIDADVERAESAAELVQELIDGATEGAEAWAVGQRGGVDVESTDETYHNNAKYYAEQAAASAASLTVDSALSSSSTNPVQNKVISAEVSSLKSELSDILITTETEYVTSWTQGTIGATTGNNNNSTNRCRSLGYFLSEELTAGDEVVLVIANGFKIGTREYTTNDSSTNTYVGYELFDGTGWATGTVKMPVTQGHAYRFVIGKTDDSSITPSDITDTTFGFYSVQTTDTSLTKSGKSADAKTVGDAIKPYTASANKNNSTILAAKYFTYEDGTQPVIDWYLLCDTNDNLYISKDLKSKHFICKFTDALSYKFGIRQNGDIIAVFRNEFSSTGEIYDSTLDNVRQNPYVLLKSEDYQTIHEVDFGNNLKPTAWLENCGFCLLPNGDIIFGEYTRMMVLWTSNLWKIAANADITDPTSWQVLKSFRVAENDSATYDETVIEHFHTVQVDPYTGTVYFATGDKGKKSQIWYSKDNGSTWTQQAFTDPATSQTVTSGPKLFRLLNFNFTEDYIYWSSDDPENHVVIRAERAANGNGFSTTITILATIATISSSRPATYGTVIYPEYGLLVMMERCDATAASMAFRAYDFVNNEVVEICTINTTGGVNKFLGFRTEYTEFEPSDGVIRIGFGSNSKYRNVNALCGNTGNMDWTKNINNLWIRIARDMSGNPIAKFGTYYI